MGKTIVSFLFPLICDMAHSRVLAKGPEESYNADSIRVISDKSPYFTLFKGNYFIGDVPVDNKPTARDSDVRLQLNIAQRLTRSKLPLDTYLFLQYAQEALWNVFQKSLPMRNLNFNPGISLGHLIVHKDKYIRGGYLMVEYESNGKGSIFSQSWDKITLAAAVLLSKDQEAQFKGWISIMDDKGNKGILKYNGILQVATNYRTDNRRSGRGVILTRRRTWFNFNTQIELDYKFNNNENQYFFLQYYSGYGENPLEYSQYKSMPQIGFMIKSQDFSIY